jgi:muramidase (phage lysozyme)
MSSATAADRAAAETSKQLTAMQAQLTALGRDAGILASAAAKREKWHFIKFAFNCIACVTVAGSCDTIVNGLFTLRANADSLNQWADGCAADPIKCALSFKGPEFTLNRSPDSNLSAMLDLVAWAEGTGASYNTAYTGAKFESNADHPRRIYTADGVSSDASGRYQFLSTTWDAIKAQAKVTDFTPASQDKAAIELMKRRGCYSAAVRGDVKEFADRCWQEWASFKSSSGQVLDKRQRAHSIDELKAKYRELLGDRTGDNLKAPLPTMTVTSPMDPARRHPVTGQVRPHNGTDFACTLGQPIIAPIGGTFYVGNDDPNGFGNSWGSIENGKTEITFGHTEKILVADGATVAKGQAVLLCGSKGGANGPHLHLEIRESGVLKNPALTFNK